MRTWSGGPGVADLFWIMKACLCLVFVGTVFHWNVVFIVLFYWKNIYCDKGPQATDTSYKQYNNNYVNVQFIKMNKFTVQVTKPHMQNTSSIV